MKVDRPDVEFIPAGSRTTLTVSTARTPLAVAADWSVLIAGGVVSGFALASVPPLYWSRIGAALFGSGAWLLRSPLGPAVLAALWAAAAKKDGESQDNAQNSKS